MNKQLKWYMAIIIALCLLRVIFFYILETNQLSEINAKDYGKCFDTYTSHDGKKVIQEYIEKEDSLSVDTVMLFFEGRCIYRGDFEASFDVKWIDQDFILVTYYDFELKESVKRRINVYKEQYDEYGLESETPIINGVFLVVAFIITLINVMITASDRCRQSGGVQ